MPRLCVSIPVHEQLPVVFDQINNIRTFLPSDTVIVLHLSQGFSSPERIGHILPEGVYVNPVSQPTAWGNVLDTHNANFEYICKVEQFDYFVLHASNDAYIRPGAERYIATADAGMHQVPIHPYIEACTGIGPVGTPDPREIACKELPLHKMVANLGLPTIYHTIPEGIFFKRDLFAEMVQIINNYWRPGPNALLAPEHFYYATAAAALVKEFINPITYSDAHRPPVRRPITIEFIDQLRAGTYVEDSNQDIEDLLGLDSVDHMQEFDFANVYAVKRVPRIYDDPIRRHIRSLAAAHKPRMQVPAVTETADFTTLAYIEEAISNPDLLKNYGRAFTSTDEAALLILINEHQQALVPQLEQAVALAGLDTDSAATIIGTIVPDDIETQVSVAFNVDAVLTGQATQPFFAHLPHVPPVVARRLKLLKEEAARR